MSEKTLSNLGNGIRITGLVILALCAAAFSMSPVLIMLADPIFILIPIVGVILFISGRGMVKKFKPAAPPTQQPSVATYQNPDSTTAPLVSATSTPPVAVARPSFAQSEETGMNSTPAATSQVGKPVKKKRLRNRLIALGVIAVVLLFNLPLLHMLEINRRLHTVSLPLSNQVASMGGNGIGPSGTNISFTVNKSYANTLEAKKDIIQKLDAAGISILKPSDEPTHTFVQDDTQSGGELPGEEIEMTFFPDYHIFTFELEPPAPCSPSPVSGNDKPLCDNQLKGDAYKKRLLSTRPVSSVRVHASVKF